MRLIFALALMMPGLALGQPVSGNTESHSRATGVVVSCPLTGSLDCNAMTASITRSSSRWCRSGTQWIEASSGAGCFGEDGLAINIAATNYWQNSLDATASATVGTPTVTADQDSGPLSTYAGGAEADQISDDDAAANEGIESDSAGTADGTYTCSAFMASGTSTDYTVDILKDGVSVGSCTGTDLTTTYSRKSCSQATGGAASTDITCTVTVGDAVTDTGTILVSGLQFEKASAIGQVCVATGAASATCNSDVVTFSTASLPVVSGTVTFDYTPMRDASEVRTFIDTGASPFVGATGIGGMSCGVKVNDTAFVSTKNTGIAPTSVDTGALTWAAETTYRIKCRWVGGVNGLDRDGASESSSGSNDPPAAHESTAYLGRRLDLPSAFATGQIKNVVWRRH